MITLVGYTGFVGSNIYDSANDKIDKVYNSKNIQEAFGTNPELLIYSGMRAEKYLANSNPQADMQLVYEAENNISKISPQNVVLISTIDVFKNPNGMNEESEVDTVNLHPYGLNRYRLEQWVRENYPEALIIRLPGLYGKNIKKNFIYDYINLIPFMIKECKLQELSSKEPALKDFYEFQETGFYKCRSLSYNERITLKALFDKVQFSALDFTDSRNTYQFYPLARLWGDIHIALENKLKLLHLATEPLSAAEVYQYLTGKEFANHITDNPVYYDYKSEYYSMFGGKKGYLLTKEQVLKDIKEYVGGMQR